MKNPPPNRSFKLISDVWHPELETRLLADIAAHRQTDPLAPMVIAVGSRLLADHLLWRITSDLSGCFNIHLITLADLSRRLAFSGQISDDRPDLPPGGDRAAVKAAIAAVQGSHYYSAIAGRPGFTRALSGCFDDLEETGLDDLNAIANRLDDRTKRLTALADLYQEYHRRLRHFRRNSETYNFAIHPTGGLSPGDQFRRCFQADIINLYGFYDFNELQWRLIEKLSEGISVHCYTPRSHHTDDFGSAFAFSEHTCARLARLAGAEPSIATPISSMNPNQQAVWGTQRFTLGGRLFRYDPNFYGQPFLPEGLTVKIMEGYDIRAEISEVVGMVNELALWRGVPLADIGIILWQPDRYRRLLSRALEEAGLPVADTIGESLAVSPPAATLLRLLELAGERIERRTLVDLLASHRLLLSGEGEDLPDPVAWESATTTMGIVAETPDGWLKKLDEQIKRNTADSWRADFQSALMMTSLQERTESPPSKPYSDKMMSSLQERTESPPSKPDSDNETQLSVVQLRLFRAFLKKLFVHLAELPLQSSFSHYTDAAVQLLRAFIPDSRERERAEELIGQLAHLDGLTAAVSREDFIATMHETLAAATINRGRYRRDGITICDRMSARGVRFRALFLPGLAEGAAPVAPREDPILPDADRRRINILLSGDNHHPLPLKSQRSEEERLLFALAVDSAQDYLIVSYSATNEKGDARLPSRFVLELCRILQGEPVAADRIQESPYHHRAGSYRTADDVIRRAISEDGYQQGRLTQLFPLTGRKRALRSLYAGDTAVQRYLGCSLSRSYGPSFTNWDGMMPDGWRSRDDERAFSVSELEGYTDCPFKYLMRHRLELESWQEPERQLGLPKMTIGSIVHRVLERLLTDIAETNRISPDNLPWAQERLRQILDSETAKARRRLPLIDIIWRLERDALRLRLNSFIQEEYREPSEFRFHTAEEEFEQSINFKASEGSLSLRLIGRIDRIDRTPDGSALRLVDYKTGSIRTKSDSFSGGVGLQSPLYLKAALQKYPECDAAASRAEYVHILPDGEVKIIPFSGEALAEKETELGDLVVAITTGISAGCFPPQPETRKCSGCDYQRACDRRSRASAQWRSDPRLTRLKEALAK